MTEPPPEVWDAMLEAGAHELQEWLNVPVSKSCLEAVHNAMELAKVKAVLGGIRIDG